MGHFFAFLSVFIWGNTYIFTKNLLADFTAFEILFIRFFIAYIFMVVLYPRFRFDFKIKDELLFALMGLSGVALYFFLENSAVKYTYVTNVGFIVSSIPLITAIVSKVFFKRKESSKKMFFSFLISIFGIALIIFNGQVVLHLNPLGDILAFICTFLWAIYTNLQLKVRDCYNTVEVVRKTFFYALLFMLVYTLKEPLILKEKIFDFTYSEIVSFMFLSIGASGLAFLTWKGAVDRIGAVKSANYIYTVPLITMLSAYIFLGEKPSFLMVLGGLLVLVGVYISQNNILFKIEENK